MASVIANGPNVPQVTRGRSAAIGTLPVNASTTAVAFTIPQLTNSPNGFDNILIFCVGGTVGTPVLEGTVDGVNWFGITASGANSSATQVSTTTFAGDTAVASANSYIVGGLSGLTQFRFGAAVTVAPTVVWVAVA